MSQTVDSKAKAEMIFRTRPFKAAYLQPWAKRMSKDRLHAEVDVDVLDVFEAQGISVESDPRSVYSVEKLYANLLKFSPKPGRILMSAELRDGIKLAKEIFARPRRAPKLQALDLNLQSVSELTSNPDGSPGLTNYGFKKRDSMVVGLRTAERILSEEKIPEPCLAYARTQFGGKTRLVWGYPYSMTILEGLVAKPLYDRFKQGTTRMAFAMSTGVLGTRIRVSSYQGKYAYSIDMKSYDSSLPSVLIKEAFKILLTWFDETQVLWVREKPVTVRDLWSKVIKYFIGTPIIMPDCRIYYGKQHGVPSGSYFTQVIDSVVNVMLCGALSSKLGLGVTADRLLVLGDDLVFWSDKLRALDDVSKWLEKSVGVTLNVEKSRVTKRGEAVHFLGRDWVNGFPSWDVEEILKRMLYPERFRIRSKDAEQRKREVRMLIVSYAAVAVQGWDLAEKLLIQNEMSARRSVDTVDVEAYSRSDGGWEKLNPDHLSGLARFRRKYFLEGSHSIPNTALAMWD